MDIKQFFSRHGGTILSVIASAGVVATAVLAVRETPKALRLIEEAEKEKYAPLTTFEKVQVTAKNYIPAAAVGAAAIACIIGANVLSVSQVAKMTAAYAALDQMYKRYKDKVPELFGEDAHYQVMDSISRDKHPENPSVYENKSEERLFMINDGTEERYFYSTMEKVLTAEINANKALAISGLVPLSDFYKDLGIEDGNGSERMGWSWDMMCDWYGEAWIDFENRLIDSDPDDPDSPDCIEIIMYCEPAEGYDLDDWEGYLLDKHKAEGKLVEPVKTV